MILNSTPYGDWSSQRIESLRFQRRFLVSCQQIHTRWFFWWRLPEFSIVKWHDFAAACNCCKCDFAIWASKVYLSVLLCVSRSCFFDCSSCLLAVTIGSDLQALQARKEVLAIPCFPVRWGPVSISFQYPHFGHSCQLVFNMLLRHALERERDNLWKKRRLWYSMICSSWLYCLVWLQRETLDLGKWEASCVGWYSVAYQDGSVIALRMAKVCHREHVTTEVSKECHLAEAKGCLFSFKSTWRPWHDGLCLSALGWGYKCRCRASFGWVSICNSSGGALGIAEPLPPLHQLSWHALESEPSAWLPLAALPASRRGSSEVEFASARLACCI